MEKPEDGDSACSFEVNSDSGRGSNDDATFQQNRTNSAPASPLHPPIPPRHPVTGAPLPRRSVLTSSSSTGSAPAAGERSRLRTSDLDAGVHAQHARQFFSDNKKYYDDRVFNSGAGAHQLHSAASHSNYLRANSIPSPSPSLPYQPGHHPQQRNLFRQQSLNVAELAPRKSVHYCSQV